jgi:hypothetical protein
MTSQPQPCETDLINLLLASYRARKHPCLGENGGVKENGNSLEKRGLKCNF